MMISAAPVAQSEPLFLTPAPPSCRAARAAAREQLSLWGRPDLADEAEAVVAELVANAVTASAPGSTPIAMRLALTGSSVRIEVFDSAPGVPAAVAAGPDAESGRGLAMVAALTAKWGWNDAGGVKVVWAVLAL